MFFVVICSDFKINIRIRFRHLAVIVTVIMLMNVLTKIVYYKCTMCVCVCWGEMSFYKKL